MLTQARLKEILDYNPDTGEFRNIKTRKGIAKGVGSLAGSTNKNGYTYIAIDGKKYLAHRLAWLYTHNELPPEIDHQNLNRSDNRIANLRRADKRLNSRNRTKQKNNTSGFKGVSWSKSVQKWHASIKLDGVPQHLGYFSLKEDAARAYEAAAMKLHGEFARV